MTAFLRRRFVLLGSLVALATAILCPAAPVTAAARVARLPGVPANVSLLFAIDFKSGALTPSRHAGARRYILTLSGVERNATWFSDRPARDAGRVNVAQLFRSWRALGFDAIAPNGAVVVDRAPASRDAMAFELHLRSFDKRTATVTFAVRALGKLRHGLPRLNRRLGLHLAPHFSSGALFIDNATYATGCTLGQPQLMALNQWDVYRGVTNLLPANGQLLPISSNQALFSLYGTTFGGNGTTTFGVPNMQAPGATESPYAEPPSTQWFICSNGTPPTSSAMGGCWPGQVSYLIPPGGPTATVTDSDWLPADGRTVPASAVPSYSSAYNPPSFNPYRPPPSQITLPNVTAPAGMRAYVCVAPAQSPVFFDLAQVDLFPSTGNPDDFGFGWVGAQGESLSIGVFSALYALVGSYSDSFTSFPAPNVPAPSSELSWWISGNGYWPLNH